MLNSLSRRFSEILRVFGPSALAISILLNTLTMLRLQPKSVDDSQYSMFLWFFTGGHSSVLPNIFNVAYIGEDHPTELPLRLDTVALTFNSSEHYGTSDLNAWAEWNSLDHFPQGHGFVRLGPNGIIITPSCIRHSPFQNSPRTNIWDIDVSPNSLPANDSVSPH
jgi:hypothetical protein